MILRTKQQSRTHIVRSEAGKRTIFFLDKWDYVISVRVYQTHCFMALLLFAA